MRPWCLLTQDIATSSKVGIKAFFGTNENAVKTQIWIAISVYVLVAIVKKRFGVGASLYTTTDRGLPVPEARENFREDRAEAIALVTRKDSLNDPGRPSA